MQCAHIISRLQSLANPENVKGMARYGINPHNTYGVSIPTLRGVAKEAGKDHELAQKLWSSGIHEARILATLIDHPQWVTEEQMEQWVIDFDSWDVCDQCCQNLFGRTHFARRKAIEWSSREEEAEEIRQTDSASARWIASDVIRELKSEAVQSRLHAGKAVPK